MVGLEVVKKKSSHVHGIEDLKSDSFCHIKQSASTAPSISMFQRNPHSNGQNYIHRLSLCNYTEQEFKHNKQTVFTKN